MKRPLNKINKFEIKHKIISFLIILISTIIITRLITFIIDPNFIIRGYELHHFHYGILLLIITSLLMLYKKGKFPLHLILTAISIGLIIDELFFISAKVRSATITYPSTFFPSIAIGIIIILIVEAIYYSTLHSSKDKNKYNNKFLE